MSELSVLYPTPAPLREIILLPSALQTGKDLARPQNLWVINIRLARFCPINSTFTGLFYLDLFRTTYSRRFFRLSGSACGTTDKNYHHGGTEVSAPSRGDSLKPEMGEAPTSALRERSVLGRKTRKFTAPFS